MGTGDSGPYPLPDGRTLLVRDYYQLAESDFGWSSVARDVPYDHLTGRCVLPVPLVQLVSIGLIGEALPGDAGGSERAAAVRTELDGEWSAGATAYAGWLPALRAGLPDDAVIAGDNAMVCYHGAIGGLPVVAPRVVPLPDRLRDARLRRPGRARRGARRPRAAGRRAVGDGGLMFSVGELASAAALGLPMPVVVFVNEGYGEIRNEMVDAGQPPVGVDMPLPDLPALARSLGCGGTAVDDPDGLTAAVAAALDAPVPTLIAVPEG